MGCSGSKPEEHTSVVPPTTSVARPAAAKPAPVDTDDDDEPPPDHAIENLIESAPWRTDPAQAYRVDGYANTSQSSRDANTSQSSRWSDYEAQSGGGYGGKRYATKRAGGKRVQAGRALRNAEINIEQEASEQSLEDILGDEWQQTFKDMIGVIADNRDYPPEVRRQFLLFDTQYRAALCRSMVQRGLHEEPQSYLT